MHRSFARRALIATAIALAFSGNAFAHIKERAFKLALQNPKGQPLVSGAEKFAECGAEARRHGLFGPDRGA